MFARVSRYAELMNGCKVVSREVLSMKNSTGVISLFSIEADCVVGLYNMKYIPGRNALDVDYLLSNLDQWSINNDRHAILVNVENVNYALVEGTWFVVNGNAASIIRNEIRNNACGNINCFLLHLATRVDLAVQLAPLSIVETTELVLASHQDMMHSQQSK